MTSNAQQQRKRTHVRHCDSRGLGGSGPCVLLAAALATISLPATHLAGQQAGPTTQPAGDVAALINRAVSSYDGGDYQACIDDLSRVLQASPRNTTARFLRAIAHGQLAVPSERRAQLAGSQQRADEAAREEQAAAAQYTAMREDIDQLVNIGLTDATSVIQLVNGVVRIKLAGYAAGSREDRLKARAQFLGEARQTLERYLRPPAGSSLREPTGLNRVRAEYFLAVVVYRQALRPSEQADAPDETADNAALATAGEMMQALADPTSDRYVKKLMPAAPEGESQGWLSYANLYLGLIRTRQGTLGAFGGGLQPETCYSEAMGYFEKAWELDTGEPYPNGEAKSAGRGLIPQIAKKHVPELEKAIRAPGGGTEDLFIDWEMGFAYDTNVILLGHNTAVPRDIGRQSDVRFGTGVAVGYTLDLGKLNDSLERWSVGAMGRASSTWHGAIEEYNEQDYGGSVALQYRLLDAWSAGSTRHGPLYASIQYDFDNFLLGNNGWLQLHRVSPQLTLYTFNERATTGLAFHYEDRNYFDRLYSNRFDRDGNYFSFSVAQSFLAVDMTDVYKRIGWEPWGLRGDPTDPAKLDPNDPTQDSTGYTRWLRPYVGFEYGWDSTKGQEFDANRFVLSAGVATPLPYGTTFDFNGQWEWQDYYHSGSLVDYNRRPREDLVQRYRFGLERQFVLVPGHRNNRTNLKIDRVVMSLRADVQFTDDDSNVKDRLGQEVFSYDRAIWGLSLAFKFN